MDGWKKRETDRCMDESIETQNEEHDDMVMDTCGHGLRDEWKKTNRENQREVSGWMHGWIDRKMESLRVR